MEPAPRTPNLGPRRLDVPTKLTPDPAPAIARDPGPLRGAGVRRAVPFYPQSLDFSCGPACLLMAMNAHDPAVDLSKGHEIDVWRESNLVEIGATSHYGLALAARRRGFASRIVGSVEGVAYKRAILKHIAVNEALMEMFHDDARAKARAAAIPEEIRAVTVADVEAALLAGEVPLVLTDTRMFTPEEEVPHWIVVTGLVDDHVYVNNPLDTHHARNEVVPLERFLAGFGYDGDQLMVAVGPRA